MSKFLNFAGWTFLGLTVSFFLQACLYSIIRPEYPTGVLALIAFGCFIVSGLSFLFFQVARDSEERRETRVR